MKNDIYHRLQLAEGDFMSALTKGSDALASYDHCWSTLLKDLSSASLSGNASDELVSLAHSVAYRISSIASCFLAVESEQEIQTTQLLKDWDTSLREMETPDLSPSHGTVHGASRLPSPTTPSDHGSPPFLPSAYKWLLDNLHNPYPSAEVKTHIATTSGCSISSINSWFISARRRIGWTSLCRSTFNNCRTDMIDAAYRAFIKEDSSRRLSSEITQSFMTIRVAAESLYASTFSKSPLAAELDAVVRDMAEHEQLWGDEEDQRGRPGFSGRVLQREWSSPSSLASSVPTPSSSDSEDDTSVVPPNFVRFKGRTFSQASECFDDEGSRKRPRVSHSDSDPRHSSSRRTVPRPLQSEESEGVSHIMSTRKKRRLSDPDCNRLPRRRVNYGPRVQTVSDPLPCIPSATEHSIDEWFNLDFAHLFEVPPPVLSEVPDQSALLEVELFSDYSLPGLPQYVTHSSTDCALGTTNANVTQDQTPSLSTSLLDDSDLTNFLQSAGILDFSVGSVTPPSQKSTSLAGTLLQDTSCLWDTHWSDLDNCTSLDRVAHCDSTGMRTSELSLALQGFPLLPNLSGTEDLSTSQVPFPWLEQCTLDPTFLVDASKV